MKDIKAVITRTSVLALAGFLSSVYAAEQPPNFTNYVEKIPGTSVTFEMVAIPGGTITIGSPKDQQGRKDNEKEPTTVTVKPFWMEKYEVSWQEFILWVFGEKEEIEKEKAQGISRPTKPYGSVYRDRGEKGYPAIGMSQLAASEYCKWLSYKTGKKYRLPTEAEWEYACRAGATSAYFWGDDPGQAKEYAWYKDNSKETTQPIGKLKPNKFGLYDIVGNVAEWCIKENPEAPGVARGGAFTEPVTGLRCAARMIETPEWNELDPQSPPSKWWLSAADFVGFRVVRSLEDDSSATSGDQAAAAKQENSQPSGNEAVTANYKKYCAGCHGQTGKGDTRLGKMMKARDYSDPAVKATLKDDQMFKAIKEGLTVDGKQVMHPFSEKLNDEEIKGLVEYMKKF